jgi:hypothetical protein
MMTISRFNNDELASWLIANTAVGQSLQVGNSDVE